jgi:biopolymer transport protein ExbD
VPATRLHRARLRRAERATSSLGHGGINLVPLIDVLTSIVFFSLLTYQGEALAALTSFDLSLPPVVVTAEEARTRNADQSLNLLLAVRVSSDGIIIEHTAEGGFHREIHGLTPTALDSLQGVMVDIKTHYPQNDDVLVVPSDDLSYDDLIHVLDRIKLARYGDVALGTRARVGSGPSGPAAGARP